MRGVRFVKERAEAVRLRKRGLSIVVIEKKLGINRSTLDGWFRHVQLTKKQRVTLLSQRARGLMKAQQKAVSWHNARKAERLILAEIQARDVMTQLPLRNDAVVELALAMLYWGEGYKTVIETGLGNSDPVMVALFVKIMREKYHVPVKQIRCELYLRADQNSGKMKKYWAKQLGLPLENFRYVSLDKRTVGSKTYKRYHGVCSVRCANVAIQRKLLNISKYFAEYILKRA
jgi:hypothetical protein